MNDKYQLFPDLLASEYEDLKADIAERGVMVPVEYDDEGNVLDGHHREKICGELGIKDFPSIVRYGLSEEEKRLHVRKLNLVRRHLSKSDRNCLMREMRAEGNTLQDIADTAGVSVKTAQRATESTLSNDKVAKTATGKDGKQRPTKYRPRPKFADSAAKRDRILNGDNARDDGQPHVSSNSGCNEWYTPVEYLKASRKVLGGIDLDPASSDVAQKNVSADEFFTHRDNGLSQKWTGRVFLNPPYSSDLVGKFTNKLTAHYVAGDVTAAILLVNNATETQWFQFCVTQSTAICFPGGRIKYLDATGQPKNSPLH